MFRSQSSDHHQGSITVLVRLLLTGVHASSYSGMWLYVVYASVHTMYLSVWCLVKKKPTYVFWFSLQPLSETFLILRRSKLDMITNEYRSSIHFEGRSFGFFPSCINVGHWKIPSGKFFFPKPLYTFFTSTRFRFPVPHFSPEAQWISIHPSRPVRTALFTCHHRPPSSDILNNILKLFILQ